MKENKRKIVNQLDTILSSEVTKILLISAKGGFGKTKTVREYLKEKQRNCIWIDLDESCNQMEMSCMKFRQEIWNVAESLHRENAGFSYKRETAAGFSPYRKMTESSDTIERLFAMLHAVNERKGIIVWDNIEVIHEKEVKKLLEKMVQQFQSISWLFLGQEEPEFLIRHILSGRCLVVTEKDLYLNQKEVEKILHNHLKWQKEKTVRTARKLMYYFQGWPAGIYEMTRYLSQHPLPKTDQEWEKAIKNGWINQYIISEIMNKIPDEDRSSIKSIAVLNELNPTLANCICQGKGTQDILEELEEKYFFLNRTEDSYMLIPSFRIVLKGTLNQEEMKSLSELVAEYYILQKQYEKATAFVLETGQNVIVEGYIGRYGKTLIQEGNTELCIDCILYFLNQGKQASSLLMQFMAEFYVWELDQKKFRKVKMLGERKFYISLLSFNQDPLRYSSFFTKLFKNLSEKKDRAGKITVLSFGTFRVLISENGKELKWRTKKGCELFAFLYQMHGNPVKRQGIMDVLWPETVPQNAVTMLHNMIYNIRKELIPYGLEDVIRYQDKKYSLNMEWIQSDLEERYELYGHKRDTCYLKEQEHLFIQYPGQYLGNIDGNWTLELKEYHDKQYIEYAIHLAREYIESKNYEKSIRILRNILTVDNLREDVVEKLLFCYSKLKDRKAVQEEYTTFKQLILQELGVEPCEKVKLMYERGMKI